MNSLAPIALFVYARPEHTKNTIEALAQNELAKESEIWIFSDNAKKEKNIENVRKVREYIKIIENSNYFKNVNIIEAEQNKGLANSIISGVTELINKYNRVIVLEDDLITSKYFLTYMNNALDFYENDNSIWSISGYNLPIEIPNDYKNDVYLGYRGCSWGWATWKNRWNTVNWNVDDYNKFKHNYFKRKKFNRGGPDMAQMLDLQMEGKVDSWAIRWCYDQFKQDKFTIYPVKSLVFNQGLDGTGTHNGNTRMFDIDLENNLPNLVENLKLNLVITKNFYNKFKYGSRQRIKEMLIIFHLDKILKFKRKK